MAVKTWKEVNKIASEYDCLVYAEENRKMLDRVRAAENYLEAVSSGKEKKDNEKINKAKKASRGILGEKTSYVYPRIYNTKVKSCIKKDFRTLPDESLKMIFEAISKALCTQQTDSGKESVSATKENTITSKDNDKKVGGITRVRSTDVSKSKELKQVKPVDRDLLIQYNTYKSVMENAKPFYSDITKHPYYAKFKELESKVKYAETI